MNTSYGNDAKNRARIAGEGVVLHPADAAARGLAEGDIARLANDQGELLLVVHVADKAPPGVAIAVKGAWPKLEASKAQRQHPACRPQGRHGREHRGPRYRGHRDRGRVTAGAGAGSCAAGVAALALKAVMVGEGRPSTSLFPGEWRPAPRGSDRPPPFSSCSGLSRASTSYRPRRGR